MKYLLLILLFFTLPDDISAQKHLRAIDSIVRRYDALGGFNGVIVIARSPDQVETYYYGYKDIRSGRGSFSSEDRFDLASLTKQFTGLAVLKLIAEGKLSADEPIGKYLPELQPKLQAVTIRQLANHRNGISDFYALTDNHHLLTREKVLNIVTALDTTEWQPDSRWGYSNSGYFLLSELISRLSGIPFSTYLRQNILLPLGMKDARFAPDSGAVRGFTAQKEPTAFNRFHSGEAGIYASANDMIAYYQHVLPDTGFQQYFRASRLLSDPINDPGWTYGFGWFFTRDSTGSYRAHSGRNPGAGTYLRWYEDRPLFICLLSNKNDSFLRRLREDISAYAVSSQY